MEGGAGTRRPWYMMRFPSGKEEIKNALSCNLQPKDEGQVYAEPLGNCSQYWVNQLTNRHGYGFWCRGLG